MAVVRRHSPSRTSYLSVTESTGFLVHHRCMAQKLAVIDKPPPRPSPTRGEGDPRPSPANGEGDSVLIDIAIPVYNEERDLERSVRRLRRYLDHQFPFEARITVVDNASTDATWAIAQRLVLELRGVRALRLDDKGRGRAIRHAWLESDAAIVAYMDVDLSTDLDGLLPLVAPLISGHSEVAIGSRLMRGARVRRGPKRELISRGYNLLLHLVLGTQVR